MKLLNALFVFTLLTVSSCDAVNFVAYRVCNKSHDTVTLRIRNYTFNNFDEGVDTTVHLSPGQILPVGTRSDIGFPWSGRQVYKDFPGVDGIEMIRRNETDTLDCSRKSWKYFRGWSTYKIRD